MLRRTYEGLFELGRHTGEGGIEFGAQAVDRGDDGDRDAGSDQAVFDGGGAGLVLQERNELKHCLPPYSVGTS